MPGTASAYVVTDYIDGNRSTATAAFNDAIADCAAAGGGTVLVPPGEFETGTISLQTNVTLRLAAGTTISPTEDESDYTTQGNNGQIPFILAEGVENVAITGRGIFDGQADRFLDFDTPIAYHGQEPHPEYPLIANAPHEARQGDDYLNRSAGTSDWPIAKGEFRPTRLFRFVDCDNIVIQGVTMRNMPSHTISITKSSEIDVTGVDIIGHRRVPNNDGIAIADSRNVHISDCTVITCDDGIVFDGTADRANPCENVTVTNCTLESSACAIKFGSGTAGVMRNFTFQNITIQDTNRGLGIQHRDEGTLENVLFTDIIIETRLPSGPWWGKAEPIYVTSVPRTDSTNLGIVRNVRFSNILARCENGALIYGSENATIENIAFEDVRLEISDSENSHLVGGNFDLQPTAAMAPIFERDISGIHCESASGIELEDVTVAWDEPPEGELPAYYSHGIKCQGVNGVTIDGFEGRQAHIDSEEGAIELADVATVTIRDSVASSGTDRFVTGRNLQDLRLFVGNDISAAATAGLPVDSDFTVAANCGI